MRHGATDETRWRSRGQADAARTTSTRRFLHLLGLNHTQLTYRYAGRNFRLTDVYGEVHREIVA